MPTPPTTIVGDAPDYLLGLGTRPRADLAQEYLASGAPGFSISSQQVLSRAVDENQRRFGADAYDAMLGDPTVRSGFFTLATGILAGEFQVLPAVTPDEGETVPEGSDRAKDIALAAEIAEFCRRQVDRLDRPIKALNMEFLLGMAHGTRLAEKVFEVGEGEDANRLCLKRLRFKRPQSWAFVVDPFGNVIAIRGTTAGGGLMDVPPGKFAIFTWMPTDGDPRGHSVLRGAVNGWRLKLDLWPNYHRYLERFGAPTVYGTVAENAPYQEAQGIEGVPDGTSMTPTAYLFHALGDMRSGGHAAFPSGTTIGTIQASDGNAFGTALDLFRREILEGVLLSARTTMEAKHGSRADSDNAQDVTAQLEYYGRESIENLWEDQIFHHLVELGWDKATADRFTPNVSLGDAGDELDSATLAAYVSAGYTIDHTQFPGIDARAKLKVRDAQALADAADAAAAGQSAGDDQSAEDDDRDAPGEPGDEPKPKLAQFARTAAKGKMAPPFVV